MLLRSLPSIMLAAGCCLASSVSLRAQNDDGSDNKPAPAVAPLKWEQHFAGQQPDLWWRFEAAEADDALVPLRTTTGEIAGRAVGNVKFGGEGPRPEQYPTFPADNRAVRFNGDGGSLRFTDPGDQSPLDFDQGDALTIEAWVNVTKLGGGQQMYVVGKGRTRNPGFAGENQNYALRLSGDNGEACLSFLFRDREPNQDSSKDYHRWNSKTGFAIDSGWHHVAVSYEFGKPDSMQGVIDGQSVKGAWEDYGGATTEPPVVDNDELWIGSSMGGNPTSTFNGSIDEVVIHRRAIPTEQLAARYVAVELPSYVTTEPLPPGTVLVEVFHGIADKPDWKFRVPEPFERFHWPLFAMTELPQNYTNHGVRGDRTNPLMVRMSALVTWPKGPTRLRLRTRGAALLKIDGQPVAKVAYAAQLGDGSDGNGGLYPIPGDDPDALRDIATGDREDVVTIEATGAPQRVELDLFCGGRKRRPELGETSLAWGPADSKAIDQILSFSQQPVPLSNASWWQLTERLNKDLIELNQQRRAKAATAWTAYWDQRHQAARKVLAKADAVPVPEAPAGITASQPIDRFIAAKLAEAQIEPLPVIDDASFLRRACLDVIGTVPTAEQTAQYYADSTETRRQRLIERLLRHPGWADNWMGYWQDVLAENPNVINPTLNNTGPFRWWLHESFSDNKPFDRFVSELILMEGSTHYGGPGGFAIASQNDSPMAAKAHILAQAFLGMEMKCARCHDAPYHDFEQRDLFSLAAMLSRKPESVPATSTIPGDPAALQSLMVKVTLKPGEPVHPEWPFADHFSGELGDGVLQNPKDRREQLAAIMTAPLNQRFNQVIVNRVWRRFFGRGFVEPVDDWEAAAPSHPELLAYLEREFVNSGYDLKSLVKQILTSQTYQRAVDAAAATDERRAKLMAGPPPRRMTAEQVVDSLFIVSGKPMNVEPLNIDVDTMRSYESSINMGEARRAWHFTSMSNERDRPSLALPGAQTVVDVLETFGWRSSRPDPITNRAQETTVLQPAILANGVVGKRVTQLSDDSRFTALALKDQPVEEFISAASEAILTRAPTAAELATYRELLQEGYEQRKVPGEVPITRTPRVTSIGVAWTNHLHPEANTRKTELKHQLDKGDPPTKRLRVEWRERAEDMIWAMLNSPEFVFIP